MEKSEKSWSLARLLSSCRKSRQVSDEPYIVIRNFEDTCEKECAKYDKVNQQKYDSLISKAVKAHKTLKKTGLTMSLEVPPPPHPCNRDRFIIWTKRNVSKKVIPQSEAVFFLTKKNYVLGKHYEAYQAIDLATEIKKKEGIHVYEEDKSNDFNDVYNNNDRNILRRRSMYGLAKLEDIPENEDSFYPSLPEKPIQHEHPVTPIPQTVSMPNVHQQYPQPFPLNPLTIQASNQYTLPPPPTAPPPTAPPPLSMPSAPSAPSANKSPCDVEI